MIPIAILLLAVLLILLTWGAQPMWVHIPVLSMFNPQVHVIVLDLSGLDGFYCIQDTCIVDGHTPD